MFRESTIHQKQGCLHINKHYANLTTCHQKSLQIQSNIPLKDLYMDLKT